jgi:hypothetical protein
VQAELERDQLPADFDSAQRRFHDNKAIDQDFSVAKQIFQDIAATPKLIYPNEVSTSVDMATRCKALTSWFACVLEILKLSCIY